MTDHHASLDRALARTKPAGGEVPAVSDGAASLAGEGVDALATTFLVRAGESEDEYRERVVREVAAHDAQVAASAEAAAGERIAQAIEAMPLPPLLASELERLCAVRINAARIARADRGSDRG